MRWGFYCTILALAGWLGLGSFGAPVGASSSEENPWKGDLQLVVVQYALGPSLHQAQISDPADLAALRGVLRAMDHTSGAPKPSGPLLLGHPPILMFDFGPDRDQVWQIAGRNQLYHPDWGSWILVPEFFQWIEAWIGAHEEAQVRLGVENPFPKDRVARLKQFQSLRERPWVQAALQGPRGTVKIHSSEVLEELFQAFQPVYVPSTSQGGMAWGHRLTAHSWAGEPSDFELLDANLTPVRPLHAALLRHQKWGLVWVPDSFREIWLDLYEPKCPWSALEDSGLPAAQAEARTWLDELQSAADATLVLCTTGPTEEGQRGQRSMFGFRKSALSSAWRENWRSATVNDRSKEGLPDCEPWLQGPQQPTELRWRGTDGTWRRLWAEPGGATWAAPGFFIAVPVDPWVELLAFWESHRP